MERHTPEWKSLITTWKARPKAILDLRYQSMGDAGAHFLADILKAHSPPVLSSLCLTSNGISDTGLSALVKSLKHITTLTKLDISFNNLTDEGGRLLVEFTEERDAPLDEFAFFGNAFSADIEASLFNMKSEKLDSSRKSVSRQAASPASPATSAIAEGLRASAPSPTSAPSPLGNDANLPSDRPTLLNPQGGGTKAAPSAAMHKVKQIMAFSSFASLSKAERTLEDLERSEAELQKRVATLEAKLAKARKKRKEKKSGAKKSASRDRFMKIDLSNVVIGEMLASVGGSNAGVYACHVDGWQCAMKELLTTDLSEEETQSCIREIHLLESLPFNKHIVRYLFHQQDQSKIRLFMTKYACSLRDKIVERRRKVEGQPGGYAAGNLFTPIQIAKYSLDIAKGLSFLHENNIIHRDIKSDNIFVLLNEKKEIGELSIGDFDTAKLVSNKTSAKTVIGTPCFMAPEVFSHSAYSFSADVYSFGLVIYELITLRLPYEDMLAKQPFLIPTKIMEGSKPPLPSHVPTDPLTTQLVRLYESCTETRPDRRPTLASVRETLISVMSSILK